MNGKLICIFNFQPPKMKLLATFTTLLCIISIGQAQTNPHAQADIHKITVEEVLQTTSYTYLLGKENGNLQWLALPKINAEVGDVYYHQKGMEMKDFKSTELDRTFESVMFLQGVERTDSFQNNSSATPGVKSTPKKLTTVINTVEGSITIAELLTNKDNYANKTVKIRAEVTKYNSNIMGKNWLHIQDGTECSGENDLTITSEMESKVGEIITVEGKVILDKDFGSGYFYKIIMEEGRIID